MLVTFAQLRFQKELAEENLKMDQKQGYLTSQGNKLESFKKRYDPVSRALMLRAACVRACLHEPVRLAAFKSRNRSWPQKKRSVKN